MDINALGQIVGQVDPDPTGDSPLLGFVWEDGALHDLNDLLGSEFSGSITEAVAINDRGQIACNARIDGSTRALLLSPR
jgi:hypothetical protein